MTFTFASSPLSQSLEQAISERESESCGEKVKGGGMVCFSRDFTFRIKILNLVSTPHKHSFFYYC